MAACAGFSADFSYFRKYMRLALLAVCSGDPAGRIDGDFERATLTPFR
jgi:hypothetical protein